MGVANKLAMMISASGMSGAALLFLCVAILFVAGMVLNVNVLLMVIIPVMIPSILAAGIHPIHFGIVAMLVAQMGVNTPPVGSLIYLTASIAECPASEVIRESLPYLAVLIALIVLLIFCPQLSTFFPAMVS